MPTGKATARSVLLLLLLGVFAGTSHAAVPKKIVFPVLGPVYHANDFGAPRGSRAHQGNDFMAPRWTPVVAVEDGRLERPSWSSSDCALILRGKSGTHYWYLHLNDVPKPGRRGGCRAGVAYAPDFKSGMRVRQGQLVGYVGNSGNARGTGTHLHFEVRPNGRGAINPYRLVKASPRLLYAVPGSVQRLRLALFGRVTAIEDDLFGVRVGSIAVSNGWRGTVPARGVRLGYAPNVVVERKTESGRVGPGRMASAVAGEKVTVWTSRFAPTVQTQIARPSVLSAERIRLRGGAARKRL